MGSHHSLKMCGQCHDLLHKRIEGTAYFTVCSACAGLMHAATAEEDRLENDRWYVEQYRGGSWPDRWWWKRGYGERHTPFRQAVNRLICIIDEEKADPALFRLRQRVPFYKWLWTKSEIIPAALLIVG